MSYDSFFPTNKQTVITAANNAIEVGNLQQQKAREEHIQVLMADGWFARGFTTGIWRRTPLTHEEAAIIADLPPKTLEASFASWRNEGIGRICWGEAMINACNNSEDIVHLSYDDAKTVNSWLH